MAIIQCPECGGTVSTTAKQCIHCGAQISICPQCENVWAGGGNFCTQCGYNIAASEQISNNSFGSQQNQYNVQQDQNSYQPQNNYDQNQYAPGQGVYTPYQNAPGQNQYYQNGFDPQQSAPRRPSDFEVILDMSKSKPLTTVLQKYYPGGFKFLFKFFGILTGVLLGFSVAVPILSMLLRSLESPLLAPVTILAPLAPVALYLSLFTVIIHSGIANFHEPVYNSVLKKQIQASNFDVNSYIRYELCNGWETCTANDIALKKHRIWVLINYQARPESTYLRIVQHIISAAAYVLFGIPALVVCWNIFLLPILGSILSSFVGGFNFSTWLFSIVLSTIVFFVGFIIYIRILGFVENKARLKWLEKYMPDMVDVYNERITNKKKKK